jgi:hypothetical protein
MGKIFPLRQKLSDLYFSPLALENVVFGGIDGFADNDLRPELLQRMKKGYEERIKYET